MVGFRIGVVEYGILGSRMQQNLLLGRQDGVLWVCLGGGYLGLWDVGSGPRYGVELGGVHCKSNEILVVGSSLQV